MNYIIFSCLLSMMVLIITHLTLSHRYQKDYEEIYNEYSSILDELDVTAIVIKVQARFPNMYNVPTGNTRIFYVLLYILIIPASLIINLILLIRCYNTVIIEAMTKRKEKDEK